MSEPVSYVLDDGIATITMDDGKANAMTAAMIGALADAFDRARDDRAVTVLRGRPGMFSAGYDLALFQQSFEDISAIIRAGGELVHRILRHPQPVIAACAGHAIAQGAFVLLACDVRLGVESDIKVGMNEVAIGLTIPHYGIEVARHQLAPQWFDRATLTGALYPPADALAAGFFHELVEPTELGRLIDAHVSRLADVSAEAHDGTKQRVRAPVLTAIRESLDAEIEQT